MHHPVPVPVPVAAVVEFGRRSAAHAEKATRARTSIATLLILVLDVSSALASDGVLEINQTCAVQTGCFSGDSAGFPVTIDGVAGSSYRLTSNLVVPDQNTDGISISVDHVSIDLAGFEIRGPVVCSGTPIACTPSTGSGNGVEWRFTNQISGHSIRNGSIRGMGGSGIRLGSEVEISNLRVSSNRLDGISVGARSIVSGNVVIENGRDGVVTFLGSKISGNTVHSNGARGITSTFGAVISGNTVNQNGGDGIASSSYSTITGCSVYGNGGNGISAGIASIVSESTTSQNGGDGIVTSSGATVSGNSAYDNDGDGIQTGGADLVRSNSVRGNAGFGLRLGIQSGYRENVVTSNTAGSVTGTDVVNLGNNTCDGSLVCP